MPVVGSRRAGSFGAPARGGLVVVGAGGDPLRAVWRLLELPERRLGLEPVDQEGARVERRLAVRRGGGDQDDALTRLEPAVAMDDQAVDQLPAPARLGLDLGQHLLR